jgi:pimeloyl-ACP methyl ester carboxylesterase
MQNPPWLDRSLYPFRSRWLDLDEGRMHYVDEGQGSPVLLVHGTPTWSFLYRDLIRRLSRTYRVVAPDHLGFGLSDKPTDAPYRPADHARRLAWLVERLELRGFTLVVHDFGGPIGVSYAVEHPANVARLVLFNSWAWSMRGDAATERVSALLGGPIGRFLYTRLNFSPRVLLRMGWVNRRSLTPALHRHYLAPFASPAQRVAPWVLARELIGSSEWYDGLWRRRERIRGIPALILWGMKDPAFGPAILERWRDVFDDATVVKLPDVGHFAMEEAAEEVGRRVEAFLGGGVPAA